MSDSESVWDNQFLGCFNPFSFSTTYNIYIISLFRERLRTVINVMGDTICAAVVAKYSQNDFVGEKPHENDDPLESSENLSKDTLAQSEEIHL